MDDQISSENAVEKPTEENTGVNRYALQCAIVASIVSIIFGYGKYIIIIIKISPKVIGILICIAVNFSKKHLFKKKKTNMSWCYIYLLLLFFCKL